MTIKEILTCTQHRPWDFPKDNWKYYQEWKNAVFLHWQVEEKELMKFVPCELEIDLYKSRPWVSVVAFTMEKIRPRNLPAFWPISSFDEINIRTYVKHNNKAGVYFLSIEGGTRISCHVARILSELPYRYSEISRQENYYCSENKNFKDKLELEYRVGEKMSNKTTLDKWLTERYALFQDTRTAINEFEIHHIEWPTFDVEIRKLQVQYPRFCNLINDLPDVVHYSTGVQVIAWNKIQHPLNTNLG